MLIVCGLYVVIWGKSKEMEMVDTLLSSNESNTVEIGLSSTREEKSNHNSNNANTQVIRDARDSSAVGHEEQSAHI